MPLRPPHGGSTSCSCRSTCSRRSSQLLAVSPPPCPLDLHADSLACAGAFGCRIGLFVAVRSWLACAVLSAWVSLVELGLLHRPSSLSPVVAVRHSLIGRPAVWCFSARQVIGFGGTGVEVDDFEARGSCRSLPLELAALCRSLLAAAMWRCPHALLRHSLLAGWARVGRRRCSCFIPTMATTGVACAASCYAVVIVVVHCCLA